MGGIYLNDDAEEINQGSESILYEQFLDNIIAINGSQQK